MSETKSMKRQNASISGSFDGKGPANKPAFSKKQPGEENGGIPGIDRLQRKPTAHAILGAYGAKYPSNHQDKSRVQKPTWAQLERLKEEIGNYIGQMAEDINTSVEMVKAVGCDHIAEFNATVKATNEDFQRFIADFKRVSAEHEGREGFISSPDELALSIQIFENYNQFRAKFEGAMHHALINFTEFALEARDRLKEKQLAEEAAKEQPVQPAESVVEETTKEK